MIKAIIIGLVMFVMAFFIGSTFVKAQTATPTNAPTIAPTTTVPSAAPKTGFGY